MECLSAHRSDHSAVLLNRVRKRCNQIGLRCFAAKANMDPGNLSRVLRTKCKISEATASKLEQALQAANWPADGFSRITAGTTPRSTRPARFGTGIKPLSTRPNQSRCPARSRQPRPS
jgi:hypothetical protein